MQQDGQSLNASAAGDNPVPRPDIQDAADQAMVHPLRRVESVRSGGLSPMASEDNIVHRVSAPLPDPEIQENPPIQTPVTSEQPNRHDAPMASSSVDTGNRFTGGRKYLANAVSEGPFRPFTNLSDTGHGSQDDSMLDSEAELTSMSSESSMSSGDSISSDDFPLITLYPTPKNGGRPLLREVLPRPTAPPAQQLVPRSRPILIPAPGRSAQFLPSSRADRNGRFHDDESSGSDTEPTTSKRRRVWDGRSE